MNRVVGALERIAESGSLEELPPYRVPGREYDHLGRQVPRHPFRGKAGVVLLLRLPGFAGQFRAVVPDEYRLGSCVLCVCGQLAVIEVGEIVECAGGCHRWFLGTESSVRVARWVPEGDEAAA